VQRTPPPPPESPAGIAALEREIGQNASRQAGLRAELAAVDEQYSRAALEWDVSQLQTARVEMNRAADARRALQHELQDLVEDAPRLQARLQAAKTELRRQEHFADLERLDELLDAFAPLLVQYRAAAFDLVELAAELHPRRTAIRQLAARVRNYGDHTGLPKSTRDVSRETALPDLPERWFAGAAGAVAEARRVLGVVDDGGASD
jgi:chromosome segregation ATPase